MIVLGSTGSIGVNTLEIAKKFSIHVEVLVAGNNIELLNKQIQEHHPKVVVVAKEEDVARVNHTNVFYSQEAILKVIEDSSSELVVNALVGFLGLRPTLTALTCNKKVALANKESLVACGAFIDTSKIQPIDSEHFGLWYLMQSRPIEKMIITASGGAFRDWDIARLQNATLADTQKHPNWSMGQKITIDSATMVNKMFELLEARWLFGEGKYDAIIETKSLIHALIDFKDGSTTAHFANASMQLPIAFAINAKMDENILPHVDLLKVGSLEFREITCERYPVWQIKEELLKNPARGVIINAANEAAIELFIDKKIGFMDIAKTIIKAYEKFDTLPKNVDDVFALDREVREFIV
ncbi:MAG: 1-deoxy-D-xylulose-5-phosphate reductoisomerase [Sulfurimonas sp. RIFOXYD12_FULL_33_39]|uniref:1-deoxy-D-xylulose-5-phosphate reductoisomerase n=1 Tax=unclassified Sulfurimonas TaxID=2623549 RepID=UPI0008C74AD7|nr:MULTISPECIES: 1-deoxy-D-xylulose-5-phosphate reductoisomerase [unclassified Sulfurimonas]OHE06762.1 MAG: 1-deoxy-D-xylulose-5-phosphate reductoisomerase [Sulfurimonas sp. RIFCSPLOWO2_12_FULL_34_6]OHE10766.1 MAG: 1-deoxy-D-xylulose-5-phosphate reductoisomerase [Sulfurimonas sp. RIFOXYD12_FULL_33_39]OHE13464.1 MAG: 1-deoxy-D-xylulose-5-phosphate reductoisomerase [Sulfurimonas sp. RIFOXYD2_FULL_34_21]